MHAHRPRVLVVDSDRDIQTSVGTLALAEGYDVASTVNTGDALAQLRQRPVQLVLVDARRADISDLGLLHRIQAVNQHCRVAFMSHDVSDDRVVEALTGGAIDYLRKPLDLERLRTLLTGVRDDDAERRSLQEAEADIARRLEFCGMIGRCPAMQDVFALIRRLAPHARSVLIRGESGTGKRLAAHALHTMSARRSNPIAVVDCSAVVETLFERELFGAGRDAGNGAPARAGRLETADGGTIVLAHVDELPMSLQARLLRVLEAGVVQRAGSLEWRRLDAHVVATTERDLRRDVGAGRFNAALYERLSVAQIHLPALDDRGDDFCYLTASFVQGFAQRFEKPIAGLTTGAERVLREMTWKRNVAELRSVLHRACALADGEFITEADLSFVMTRTEMRIARPAGPVRVHAAASTQATPLNTVERDHIVRTLERVQGNKAVAARLLGVSRRAFYRQLERHGLYNRARVPQTASTETAPILEQA